MIPLAETGVIGKVRSAALIALLASASTQLAAGAVQEASALAPGTVTERTLARGQVARHTVLLDIDQAATLVLTHRSIDVIVRLIEPGADASVEVASPGPTGELMVPLHAARSGTQTIEVAAAYPKNPDAGSYGIQVRDVRRATARERQLAEAARRHTRAGRLWSNGFYDAARPDAEQALTLREQALGPSAVEVAHTLLLLGQIDNGAARFAAAAESYHRARGIVDRAENRDGLLLAAILDRQAGNDTARGQFADAERFVTEALAIRERMLGSRHALVAASLGTLADMHHDAGNVAEARQAADRAWAIASEAYQSEDLALAVHTDRVARAQLAAGNYARAAELYGQTLAVRERSTGADSLAVAESVGGLARAVILANDNVKAEELHLRSVAIRERVLGPDHPQVANDLNNLGLIRYRRRDYTGAIELYTRALAIREKAFGAVHPIIPTSLNNFGLVYWRMGDYRRAEEFYLRALEMSERLYGADSLRVTSSLTNLGIIAKETGNYALAEARMTRALAIAEKHYGRDHPQLITVVESLAILYRDRGDYAAAEVMFQRAMGITVASLGPDHPFVGRHLENIGQLNWAIGNFQQALSARQRYLAIEEHHLPLNLSVGSERQKLAYFAPFSSNLNETIAFHVQQPAEQPAARDLAITTLLQRKGRIFDALADSASAVRSRSAPGDQALLDRLSRVTSDLAAAAFSESTRSPLAERQRQVAALAAERERLEIDIHKRTAGYLEPSRPLTLAAVQDAVPPDAALIEFSIYRPVDPRAAVESGRQFGAARYVAYVVRHRGEVGWKDLGPAEAIDRVVDDFRSALSDPARSVVMRLAAALHGQLIAPLQPLVGDARHLLISPDGPLNLIPFEALRTSGGRYLVEDLSISYLSTGRDLVRMLAPRPAPRSSVVVADPAFGEPPALPIVAPPSPARDPSSRYFAPLAGTAGEARRIHALFPDAELRTGAAATERSLKELRAPRLLHIATHGFFLQDEDAGGARAPNLAAQSSNPLLRSGLALAGANRPPSGGDDGILTALEAAGLNLWGTRLVTLSACDTGLGVVRNGEGVYGLRRAFFLAGAESLVMSLWPVSDQITREMMTGYYQGLRQGLGRGAALRRMQLDMLKRNGRAHPFYWAGFILAGEWAALDGRR